MALTQKNNAIAYHIGRSERFFLNKYWLYNPYQDSITRMNPELIFRKEGSTRKTAAGDFILTHSVGPWAELIIHGDTTYRIRGRYMGRLIGAEYDNASKTFNTLCVMLACPTNHEGTEGPILMFDLNKVDKIVFLRS